MIEQFHCDHSYILASSSLDSYPVVVSSDCVITATSTASSTGASYLNGFSHGELINGFFLLLILVVLFFKVITDRSLGVKSQNRENY